MNLIEVRERLEELAVWSKIGEPLTLDDVQDRIGDLTQTVDGAVTVLLHKIKESQDRTQSLFEELLPSVRTLAEAVVELKQTKADR